MNRRRLADRPASWSLRLFLFWACLSARLLRRGSFRPPKFAAEVRGARAPLRNSSGSMQRMRVRSQSSCFLYGAGYGPFGRGPETPMQMRHEGSSHAALTSTVRIAGKKADDRFHRYNAFSRVRCRRQSVFQEAALNQIDDTRD
jgi:hypothetical protein